MGRSRHRYPLALALWAILSIAAAGDAAAFGLEPETMDRTADPCRDFYRFANGRWLDRSGIPPDRARYGVYDELTERNLLRLRAIARLAETAGPAGDPATRLVGAFWHSGMDERSIEAAGLAPLQPLLARIDAVRERGDLLALVARLHESGVEAVFAFAVDQDARHAERYLPILSQAGLGLPDRDYYLDLDSRKNALRQRYVLHVARMLELLGTPHVDAWQDAHQVLALETLLASASMTAVELRDPLSTYNPTLAPDLPDAGVVPWQRYLAHLGLTDKTLLNIAQPRFFTTAADLIAHAPLYQWRAYLRWHLVNAYAPFLARRFVEADFDFRGRALRGTPRLAPRWKRTLAAIDRYAGEAFGRLYAERHFGPEARLRAGAMVEELRRAMRDSIDSQAWMSEPTRVQARAKLDAVVVKIGHPARWRDYAGLEITDTDFAGNVLRANAFELRRNLGKLNGPVDRDEWSMTAPTVNAYYNPARNEIAFPAGILQPPLFDARADDASNYGNMGATMGHELTHAFDDEGRQYDAAGNLRNWWTRQDEINFVMRAAGVEQQFARYEPIKGVRINGRLTAGENIADLGGLRLALRAMERVQAGRPDPGPQDGLTPLQRFFVAYAQSFRANIRLRELRLQLATDAHAPDRYRVIGPLANMPEFRRAFSCAPAPARADERLAQIW